MSVIGQEAGIEHGSMRGYRQHTYRKIQATEEWGCLNAVREYQRKSKPVTAGTEKQALVRRPVRTHRRRDAARASDPPARRLPGRRVRAGMRRTYRLGWVRVHVQGSTVPPRTFCSGSCATVGIALAELRMKSTA
ncbi:hypothetical protein ACFWGI_26945 [Streptomyces niveus]|uniref:hypothetical protein n=1 Tax=Streptomyces niveus TaxID=193462 RepID=UPI00364E13C6